MHKIVPIVEGEGEKKAVPTLCYKLLHELQRFDIFVATPIVCKGVSNLLAAGRLENLLEAAYREPGCAAVLVVLDADDDCALALAQSLSKRAQSTSLRASVFIVVAAREYEAWFLASLNSLRGQTAGGRFTLPLDWTYTGEVETRRGVKEWISKSLPAALAYSPTVDQAALTSLIDPAEARTNSRSFRRLCHAIEQILDAIDNNKVVVTPEAG